MSFDKKILVAMAVFSADRAEGITEPQKVEEAQVNLVKALQFVCVRDNQPRVFPNLVLKLTDLRYLVICEIRTNKL